MPPGSCDTHIFGPPGDWPLAEGWGYTPRVARLPAYRAVMRALGINRAVLVQPSVYGTDNRLLVATLAEDPAALRGWPWWRPTSGRRIWPRCMRGIRLNTRNPLGPGFADLEPLGRRVVPLGWHQLVQSPFPGPPGVVAALVALRPDRRVWAATGRIPSRSSLCPTTWTRRSASVSTG